MDLTKSKTTLEYDKILAQIADLAHTETAKTKIKNLRPSIYKAQVEKLLNQTTDAKRMATTKGSPMFGNVRFIADIMERAIKGAVLSPLELLNIAAIYRSARGLLNYHRTNKKFDTSIDEIFDRLFVNKILEDKISKAIISEDMIADEASPLLSDIRRKIKSANSKVRENLVKYTTSDAYSKYLQENIVTIRNGRYVIPVKTEYKNEIKGLVHDTSSSGATLFIEPFAVVEINNEIKILEKQEHDEIERILAELSANCADFADEINLNHDNITELAVIFAKSEYSFKLEASSPVIVDEKKLFFYRARHPLIDKKKVVAIDIGLGESYDTLVITGPNTGGKTVSLKTLGLFVMMAQTGIHIPCDDSSYMGVFDEVLADIGDEQSIEQSLSTFSSHMTNIIKILESMTPDSIILFDELGSGTDPVEGAALAVSVLERVHSVGSLCVATTHYAELKVFALETTYAKNASCEFDIETLKPTYKLSIGTPGRSNAFAISQRLGLEETVIKRAKELVKTENKKFENVVGQLEEEKNLLEKERTTAQQLRRDMESQNRTLEQSLKKKTEEAEKSIEKAREEARRILASAKASSNYVFGELEKLQKQKDEEAFKQQLIDMKLSLKADIRNFERDINPKTQIKSEDDDDYILKRELVRGDKVYLKDAQIFGEVENEVPDKDGNIAIKSGFIKIKTKISNIKLAEDIRVSEKPVFSKYRNVKQTADKEIKQIKNEIDVRGQIGEDAWFMVDRYIDDSKNNGLTSVRIIHGKGTGALRLALWKFFKSDKRIESFRLGQFGEGDYGVTVLELK